MRALAGYIALTRPANMFICGLSVVCGGIISGRPLDMLRELVVMPEGVIPPWAFRILSGALSAALILAAGNVFNDIRDIGSDRINTPHRPLPSGSVPVRGAWRLTVFLVAAGLACSVPLGWRGMAVAGFAALLLAAYDLRLKGIPLLGNIAVALLGGLAFLFGGLAGGSPVRAFVPAGFAVLFHLGRELIKDAADIRGDRDAGIGTVATVWGIDAATKMAAAVLLPLAGIVLVPSVTGYFGIVYTVYVALLICPILLYAVASALHDGSEENLRHISLVLKVDMPLGILAVIAGYQGW
jgi:geranylgeranylglycerol-phosphate geranylgeranyltransferase